MSYWVTLTDPITDEPCLLEDMRATGGLILFNDLAVCSVHLAHNYLVGFDFSALHGKRAEQTLPELNDRIAELGTQGDDNPWNPSHGNVGHVLDIFREWSERHPYGVWRVE